MDVENQSTGHLKSPFQLNKTFDKSLRISPLPSQSNENNGNLETPTTPSSVSSDTSETVSPKNWFGPSPFSLQVKKLGSVSLSTAAPVVPNPSSLMTSSSSKDLSPDQKIIELQKELVNLRKGIETRDAKLSSSVKSIKQFWSPELKKERAARKEDSERYLLLKEKYQISNTQIEEYKKTVEDLESELTSQQQQINILTKQMTNMTKQQNEMSELEQVFNTLKQSLTDKDEELHALHETLDKVEDKYKQLEIECDEKNHCISDLEIILVEQEKQEKDHEADKKELEVLYKTLGSRENEFQNLQEELSSCQNELKALQKTAKNQQEQADKSIDENELAHLKDMVSQLEIQLATREELYESAKKEIQMLQRKDDENTEKINELEDLFLAKDKEYDKVQLEALELRNKLENAEKLAVDFETELQRYKYNEVDNVQAEILSQKENEIKDLTARYEKLDKYLSEREIALENCREELKEVKSRQSSIMLTKDQLENQLYEQKALVDRLEKQKSRNDKMKEEIVNLTVYNDLKKENEKLETSLQEHSEQLSQKDGSIDSLTKKCEETESNVKELLKENKKLLHAKESITTELEEAKKKLLDVDKQRMRGNSDSRPAGEPRSSSTVKENKSSKHLWDELSKKETKIEELEKQLKEKNRQLLSMKKTQNADKKEQHEIANEAIKTELATLTQEKQEEIDKKEKRIKMLEDALRESVTIAAEREDILARNFEMSEEASKKVSEIQSEYDRIVVEKAITNIKNAFLILSLSERDALVASMKATRKRHMEELMNIKQEGLLSSISEKDNQIAHLELQASKNKRQEIRQLKAEKEKFVSELKEQNNARMALMINESKENLIIHELKDAPAEQVYEAIRHLCNGSNKLEFYVEELIAFLREKNVDLLKDFASLPRKKARSVDKLKNAKKDELMRELTFVEEDGSQLKKYVYHLLDKLDSSPT